MVVHKTRATSSRGGRGGGKRTAKPGRQGIRNITRWSANKDIALLCGLAKECRRDKFQPSWDRVAKWIGPNITGAAVEQHIAKLYSKLVQHRASSEPKPKKKKGNRSEGDDVQADYVKNEEEWGKGNEALANVFYDKPDISSMLQTQYEVDSDSEMVDEVEQTSRKRSMTGRRKQTAGMDDENDQDYLEGDPNELFLAGTKYLPTDFEAENDDAAEFDESVSNNYDYFSHKESTPGTANFPHNGNPLSMSGNGAIDNQHNFSEGLIDASLLLPYPGNFAFSKGPAFVHGMNIRSQQSPLLQTQRIRNNTASPNMQGGGGLQRGLMTNPLAMKMGPDNDEHIYTKQRFDGPTTSGPGVKRQLSDSPYQTMMDPMYNWHGHPRMGNLDPVLYGMGQSRNAPFLPDAETIVGVRAGNMRANLGYGTMKYSPKSDASKAYLPPGHKGIGVNHDNNFQDNSLTGFSAPPGISLGQQQQLAYRAKPGHSTQRNEENPYLKNLNTGFKVESEVDKDEVVDKREEDASFFSQYLNDDVEAFGESV